MNEQTQPVVDEKKNKEKKQMISVGIFFVLLILFWIVFSFLTGLSLAIIGAIVAIKMLDKKPELQKFVPTTFVILIVFILGAIFIPAIQSDKKLNQTTQIQQQQKVGVEIPSYKILDKVEHISTRGLNDRASYFGDVLIEGDVINIPPKEFIEIARVIVKQEGLDYSASFYLTEEAYRANYDSTWEGSDKALDEGYIGTLEKNEFRMSPSSSYYKQHRADNDEENNWIIR